MKLSKPAAIITDMDGTILDSEGFAKDVWHKAGKEIGIDVPERILNEMIGSSVIKTNSLFLDHFGADFDVQNLRKVKTEIELASYGKGLLTEKPGTKEFLSYIKSISLPLGLATTTEELRAVKRLDEINVRQYFDFLAFGDQVHNQKPDPEIYYKVADALGVRIQDCLVIEDSVSGVAAGVASGAQVVWIRDIMDIDDELKEKVIEYPSLYSLRTDLKKLF